MAYVRLAFWNLDGFGQANRQYRDPALIAKVINRFDVVAIQGLTTIRDLDILIGVLNDTGTSKWSRVGGGDGPQSAPSIIWRSERVIYDDFVRATPLTASPTLSIHPLLLTRMRFHGNPFYIAVIDIAEKVKSAEPLAIANLHLASLAKHSGGIPVFVGMSLAEPIRQTYVDPFLKFSRAAFELQSTAVKTRSPFDLVLTTSTRPVNAGVFPYHKIMALDSTEAADKISARLPTFVLSTMSP